MSPNAALRPCLESSCGRLVESGRCSEHRLTTKQRGYSGAWRRIRLLVLDRDPICKICRRAPATEADHILPKPGGTDELENLQGLCKPCHSKKTAAERAFR